MRTSNQLERNAETHACPTGSPRPQIQQKSRFTNRFTRDLCSAFGCAIAGRTRVVCGGPACRSSSRSSKEPIGACTPTTCEQRPASCHVGVDGEAREGRYCTSKFGVVIFGAALAFWRSSRHQVRSAMRQRQGKGRRKTSRPEKVIHVLFGPGGGRLDRVAGAGSTPEHSARDGHGSVTSREPITDLFTRGVLSV